MKVGLHPIDHKYLTDPLKCTGEDPCYHCQTRKVSCVYIPVTRPERASSDADLTQGQNDDEQGSPTDLAPIATGFELSPAEPSAADTKVEQLESRVRALERMMSHMAEIAKHPRYNDQYVFRIYLTGMVF